MCSSYSGAVDFLSPDITVKNRRCRKIWHLPNIHRHYFLHTQCFLVYGPHYYTLSMKNPWILEHSLRMEVYENSEKTGSESCDFWLFRTENGFRKCLYVLPRCIRKHIYFSCYSCASGKACFCCVWLVFVIADFLTLKSINCLMSE